MRSAAPSMPTESRTMFSGTSSAVPRTRATSSGSVNETNEESLFWRAIPQYFTMPEIASLRKLGDIRQILTQKNVKLGDTIVLDRVAPEAVRGVAKRSYTPSGFLYELEAPLSGLGGKAGED